MEKIDTATIERLLHAAILLRTALTKAREEMPPSFVCQEINHAEHRVDDAVDSLRTARKWNEDEYMNGSKGIDQLMLEVGITLGKCEMTFGKTE